MIQYTDCEAFQQDIRKDHMVLILPSNSNKDIIITQEEVRRVFVFTWYHT